MVGSPEKSLFGRNVIWHRKPKEPKLRFDVVDQGMRCNIFRTFALSTRTMHALPRTQRANVSAGRLRTLGRTHGLLILWELFGMFGGDFRVVGASVLSTSLRHNRKRLTFEILLLVACTVQSKT